ncbi:MAG: helix-turn-helix domain-containing protein [Gammaproteobacteria bacterium]
MIISVSIQTYLLNQTIILVWFTHLQRQGPPGLLPGARAARAPGRTGGRPPALTDKDLAAARALLADPAITVEEAARRLNVAPSTLYRHLPGGRGALIDGSLP